MQWICDAIKRRRTLELGNGHVLVVSPNGASVSGYTLVHTRYNGGEVRDMHALCEQLHSHCMRFRVSLRVESTDDSRMVVGVFVYIPRLATVLHGVSYTLEFERRGRAGSRIEHLVALERALDMI